MQEKENIKELFFNKPTKHWHFEQLVTESGLSRSRTNEWLKKLLNNKTIKKVKNKGKMPYYSANYTNEKFGAEKKTYTMKLFEKTGFLAHLKSLKAETVIIFGSFSRDDWNDQSDIDLFIYGDARDFEKGFFERKLKREIQVFNYENEKELSKLEQTTMKKIVAGINVKNSLEPFKVVVNA